MNTATTAHTEWPARLALVAVAFQALFAMTHFSDGLHQEYGGVAALLLLVVAGGKRWRSVARHPLPWLVLAFIVYAVLQAACTGYLAPELPLAKRLAANAEPVRVGAIACAIGVWMAAQPRRLPWLLGLMVAGFVLGALASMPWARLDAIVTGALALRFNYAENLVGEYAVMGLLLLSLFALSRRWHGRTAIAVALAMVLVGVLLLACLLYAQSRGAWLAALLVPLVAVAYLRDTRRRWWRGTAMVLGVSASVVAVALAVGGTFVTQRLAGGEIIAEALLNGQLAMLPPSSVTLRMQLAALGWHVWQAHPLFGIGLHGIEPVIVASGIHAGGYVPPHLHDAYLQIAVGLGGIGAALLLATLVVLVRELWLAHRAGDVDSALYWMLLGSLGVVLVVNISDFLLWRAGYLRAPLELLLGCCFAVSLRHRQAARERGALKMQP